MNPRTRHIALGSILITAIMVMATSATARAQTEAGASFLYRLSDFSGPVASMWARISIDPQTGEIYTLDRRGAAIRVYNQTAMQVYDFGEGLGLASATDIATSEEGDIFVLYRSPAATVRHLDYRGQLVSNIKPAGHGKLFNPEFIDYRYGKLYLADPGSMQVLVTSLTGEVLERQDFRQQVANGMNRENRIEDMNEAQRRQLKDDLESLKGAGFNGFSVDTDGNIYFTLPSMFVAYRYSPRDGLEAFGIAGSAPGKFGVVASIVADSRGNVFVSDRLRSVVLMFDRDLEFQAEFGYRGSEPQNLIVPDDIAIDEANHRIYVAQAANLGVSAFSFRRDTGTGNY